MCPLPEGLVRASKVGAMADDDVRLTDLEVIQQFSLAVRGATASRAEVIAALEADLAYLRGGRRQVTAAAVKEPSVRASAPVKAPARPVPATASVRKPAAKKPAVKAPVKRAPVKAPAKKAPVKKAPAKAAAKKSAVKKATRSRRA